jgi:hypothetical protein
MQRFGHLWCTLMHNSMMWPIHGHYQCRRCGRRRPVPWAQPEHRQPAAAISMGVGLRADLLWDPVHLRSE